MLILCSGYAATTVVPHPPRLVGGRWGVIGDLNRGITNSFPQEQSLSSNQDYTNVQ